MYFKVFFLSVTSCRQCERFIWRCQCHNVELDCARVASFEFVLRLELMKMADSFPVTIGNRSNSSYNCVLDADFRFDSTLIDMEFWKTILTRERERETDRQTEIKRWKERGSFPASRFTSFSPSSFKLTCKYGIWTLLNELWPTSPWDYSWDPSAGSIRSNSFGIDSRPDRGKGLPPPLTRFQSLMIYGACHHKLF